MIPGRKLVCLTAGVCLFLITLVLITAALLLVGGALERGSDPSAAEGRIFGVVVLTLASCWLAWVLISVLHDRYLRAALRMAEEVDAVISSGTRLGEYGSTELRVLGRAVNRLAAARDLLAGDVAMRVQEAKASLEQERSRLAALMAELNQSVVVCNLDGRVLLYNQRAQQELCAGSENLGSELLGLGRSIYHLFDRSLIAHALERLQHKLNSDAERPSAQFVTATRSGKLLLAHMSPVLAAERIDQEDAPVSEITGFVLILDDITATNERDARRDALIQSLTEGGRGPLGSIRAAAETLSEFADISPEQRERFLGVIQDEARALSRHLEGAAKAFSDDLRVRWPLEEMLGAELVGAAVRRISERSGLAVKINSVDESIWLRIDSFGLLQALSFLTTRLHDEYHIREVRLALSLGGRLAQLDLMWFGTSMNNETAMAWELDSMTTGGEATPLSVREVIDRCNGEIWFQRERVSHRAFYRILLPAADSPKEVPRSIQLPRQGSRPEFYDFDLFQWSASAHELDDRPLSELAYTVFDTETTGLQPSEGDEIIQIGATRIVNRRLLHNECFDQLVDPQHMLSRESIGIHGITPDLLVGQPTIDTVLPAFHAFCADTVLLAHNAAFDMRFLQLKQQALGLNFDQPVLDTLLLSAALHPNQTSHRLEAIAERLGVSVIGRHTALGDAMVTGEIFLKMLPLLAGIGIHTLRQAREASQRTYHARLKY
ncbi:MAG: DNA polymerase III subunit epsilon [Propionivibrio sp.]|uniref:3'-5' exonuclease n=1 Tax=Propionivibrio sp. TaxID=2212460 RepID=UPI0025D71E5B|nr:exonuclease domain-containing protein [Propionivibrio sp.]MBL0208063.1 DNA polymerase III subunit epsilon [Propionivibrio sp.]